MAYRLLPDEPVRAGQYRLVREDGAAVPVSVGRPPDAIERSAMEAMKPNALERFGRGFADVTQGVKQLYLMGKDAVTGGNEAPAYTQDKTDELQRYERGRGQNAGIDWLRLAGNVAATAPTAAVPGAMAPTLGIRSLSGAASGGLSSLTMFTPEGESKIAQTLVGAGFGAAVPAIIAGGKRAIMSVADKVRPQTNINIPMLEQELTLELKAQGIDFNKLTGEVKQSLLADAQKALQVGGKLNPEALERKAVIESVGAKPTVASVTRDPRAWQTEKNLRGIQGVGDPIVAREQSNAQAMVDYLAQLRAKSGGKTATKLEAGESAIGALRGVDDARGEAVGAAYRAARDETGRYAPVDAKAFSESANAILDEQMLGRFLPEKVRGLLNDVSEGKIPLNVNTLVQVDSVMSAAQRSARKAGDDAGAKAIGVVRDALNNAPMLDMPAGSVVPGASRSTAVAAPRTAVGPVSDDIIGQYTTSIQSGGQVAKEAFDNARRMARDRFAARESAPALQAAVDDVAPDRFVDKYILGAPARDLRENLAQLKASANGEQAIRDIKGHLFDNLLMKATGALNVDDVAGRPFSGVRFNKALESIAPEKLHQLFTPSEVESLRALQTASKYLTEEVPFSDVNHSKTAAALANLLAKIGDTPLLGQIVSPIIGVGKIGADWVKNAKARRQVAEALLGSTVTGQKGAPALPVYRGANLLPSGAAAALNQPSQGLDD